MIKAIRMLVWMTFLTGIAYPLFITSIALMKGDQGKLIKKEGKIVGSELIAQPFSSPHYFWPRPSAIDYNPLPSGGSNLGPTSRALQEALALRKAKFAHAEGSIPSELLFASGSGLDPHITLQGAYFQIPRVAGARGLEAEHLKSLVEAHREKGGYVNVLMLNMALDQLSKEKS